MRHVSQLLCLALCSFLFILSGTIPAGAMVPVREAGALTGQPRIPQGHHAAVLRTVSPSVLSVARGDDSAWQSLEVPGTERQGDLAGGVSYYLTYDVLTPDVASDVWAERPAAPALTVDAGVVAALGPDMRLQVGATALLAPVDGSVLPTALLHVDFGADTLTLGLPESSFRHVLGDGLALRLCANLRSGYEPASASPTVVPRADRVAPGIAAAWLDWDVGRGLLLTLGAECFFATGMPRLDGAGSRAPAVDSAGVGGVLGVRLVF